MMEFTLRGDSTRARTYAASGMWCSLLGLDRSSLPGVWAIGLALYIAFAECFTRQNLSEGNYLLGPDMRMFKTSILQRNRNVPIEEEQGAHVYPELRPEARREPHSVVLPLVDHVETKSR